MTTITDYLIRGPRDLNDWRERYRLPVPDHQYMQRFINGHWDGTKAPGKWCRKHADGQWELRISRGLWPRLARDLPAIVAPPPPVFPPPVVTAFLDSVPEAQQLRDYQTEAITSVLTHGWGRIALATNAGKGAVIALLARFAASRGARALVCCDEIAVLDALEEEIEKWSGITPGIVAAGKKEPPDAPVVLAMVPTLARRVKDEPRWQTWAAQFQMVLLDEADKATAATWRRIITATKNSHVRVGFSGTFEKEDDLFLELQYEDLMGPVLLRARNLEMVERGVSVRPLVELHSYDASPALAAGIPAGWWDLPGAQRRQAIYEVGVVENADRHHFIWTLLRDVPTAVIVNRVDHGHNLASVLPDSVFVDGSVTPAQRRVFLDAFRDGQFKVLIVTKILDRGTNRLGHAKDIIFASGEGSRRQTLQRIGRGLRRHDGKNFLRLVDVVDIVRSDGYYGSPRKWLSLAQRYMRKAAFRRLSTYVEEGFDTRPMKR